jgi:hypothetical protein
MKIVIKNQKNNKKFYKKITKNSTFSKKIKIVLKSKHTISGSTLPTQKHHKKQKNTKQNH